MHRTASLVTALLLFSLFSLSSIHAIPILYEGFGYNLGNLDQANTGNKWSRTGTGDSIQVVDGNLSYPGMATSTGRMAQWGGNGRISRTDFTAVTSGTIYASFLFRVDTIAPLTKTGGGLAGLLNAANTENPNSRVYIRQDLDNINAYNLGILERGSAITWSNQELLAGDTHFIVFNLDFIAGDNNDRANLWIDPTAATFGGLTRPNATISASGGIDAAKVDRFRLIQNPSNGSPGQQSLDELRIGTTWADVTVAVPEPAAICLSLLAGLSLIRRRR